MKPYTSNKNRGIGWGILLGITSPWVIMPAFIFFYSRLESLPFGRLWYNFFHLNTTMSRILSLCMIANLVWFYLFLNKERYGIARGVILGTLAYFPLFIYLIYF